MAAGDKDAGAETCRRAFGSLLTQQGRGYYVTLELLAIAWGTHQLDGVVLPTDLTQLRYRRRSHDFARRWMANDTYKRDETGESRFVTGDDAEEILRALLESLRVPIPNRRQLPAWLGQHLYPYVGELIHYDAAPRTARKDWVSIERYAYRGAGGLAHHFLRSDPDAQRRESNARGLEALVRDSGGPLGQLANACASHDLGHDRDAFVDETETKAVVDPTDWVDHLRDGVRNITARPIVRAKQVELLMHWVPYCIARHQLDRACRITGRELATVPASLMPRAGSIRNAARREFDRARGTVDDALRQEAARLSEEDDPDAEAYGKLLGARQWRVPMVGFFSQTLATVGSLNAHTGSRYLTLRLPLLEAIVHAALEAGEEIPFELFCERVLGDQFRIAVGDYQGGAHGPFSRLDAAELAENTDRLAQDLEGLGLLTAYSDATRMVHGEVR